MTDLERWLYQARDISDALQLAKTQVPLVFRSHVEQAVKQLEDTIKNHINDLQRKKNGHPT